MARSANPRAQREREAERQRSQDDARRRVYQKAVRRRRLIGIGVLIAIAIATVGTVAIASSSKQNATPTTAAPTTKATTDSTVSGVNPGPPASLPQVAPGASIADVTPCPPANGSAPRTTKFAAPPPLCINPTLDYTAKVRTSKGDLIVSLLAESSPTAVNNFVTLARYHYYDGLPVTRIQSRAWAEVADPKNADGSPAPGYTIKSEAKPQGSIATPLIFATIPDQAGNAGGGFLFGLADQSAGIPQNATQIGNILDSRLDRTKGPECQSTVQHAIDLLATKSGAPAEVVTITGITIVEGRDTEPVPPSSCP